MTAMDKNPPERIKKDIIDNTDANMSDILNSEIPHVTKFDVSTGYFDVAGYGMLRKSLENTMRDEKFKMRLMLGKEAIVPDENSFEKYAKKYSESINTQSIKSSIEDTEISKDSLDDTTSLIKLLTKDNIQVRLGSSRFNHSKCYILGNNSAFIGSSNLTAGGMTANYELNAGLYQPGVAEATRQWFDRMWEEADDTKQTLIDVLNQSKFGIPPEPYQVYMKILFEQYRPLLENLDTDEHDSKTLTKFQQEAVRTGLFIMAEFGGVMIADATGLGKTNMGIEIIRQKVLKEAKRVLLIAPSQVLHSMWEEKLKEVDINVRETLTMESLGREEILENLGKYRNIDLVLIDESQNFRSKTANRRKNLMKLMSIGKKKQAVLLSATPINNSLMDLYYQLSIITGGDDYYFHRTIGIPDLYKHMRDAANKDKLEHGLEKIQQLLDTVMVRRTRSYIKEIYKDDKINDQPIKFPAHQYSPIQYSLTDLFGNIFEKVLNNIRDLTMAPYGIDLYRADITEEQKKKHRAAAHLQIILLLKRFESSVEAVRISLENKVNLYRYIGKIFDEGKILRVRDFNSIMAKWNSAEIQGDTSDLDIDESEKMEFFLKEIEAIPKEKIGKNYDIEKFGSDMKNDMLLLENLLDEVKKITVDTKLDEVIRTIMREKATEKESKKVLIFSEYTATARYITKHLKEKFKGKTVECITGRTDADVRKNYIRRFAPKANLLEDEKLDQPEIDILISTEVLAEGQNLQDCNYVINYDLPWNPMRIVQRTGRIDRLTSGYDLIRTRACYPDKELDAILKIMGNLLDKIGMVDIVIGGDTEVLGEIPTPKQFNGTVAVRLKTLASGDDAEKVIMEMERESDAMPAVSPINELSKYVKEMGIEKMQEIPLGRRSGKKGESQRIILAYLQERPERRVYFVSHNFKTDSTIVPEQELVMRELSCKPDTERHLPMDGNNNRESFELLLGIDKKAREAIKKKDDQILNYVEQMEGRKITAYKKIVAEISSIIMNNVVSGNLSEEEGRTADGIITSEYVRPWDDTLGDLYSDYERTKDIDGLIKGIKKINEYIGIRDKTESIKTKENEDKSKINLIGAMFITGDKFEEKHGNKMHDVHV